MQTEVNVLLVLFVLYPGTSTLLSLEMMRIWTKLEFWRWIWAR